MFALGRFFIGIAQVLNILLTIYMWVIIIRALISWVNPDPFNPIVQFLYRVTEPALAPIRHRIPNIGGIDISPLVAILIIIFLQTFFVGSLHDLGASLR